MTYRGSLPGSGYGQNDQQWPQQNMQQATPQNAQGFDAYGNLNPQYQYPNPQYQQYQNQNAAFAPQLSYQQPQQQQQHHQQQQQQQQQHHQQHHQHRQHQQHHQQLQAANANYVAVHANQYPNYEPSFDQRPVQPQYNGASYGGQVMSAQSSAQRPAQRPVQQSVQQSSNQHVQQQIQHPQHQAHIQPPQQMMDWQQMPPPGGMPSPMVSNQATTSILQQAPSHQAHTQQQIHHQQRKYSGTHHTNSPHIDSSRMDSPGTVHSPQLAQQLGSLVKSRSASSGTTRMDQASRVSASPRLTTHGLTRSPSVSSTKSPALTPGLIPHHQDTNSLLVCVAEELFTKARREVLGVADSLDSHGVHEYQKMIATGLSCLETVLNSNKLAPRLEAKLQLRYASILCEETNNLMEAETALTKGITLCDKYRFVDLKYLMQFLQLRMLSQRKGKAAMISVDARITDAELFKHTQWVYALRFFKASLYLQSANPSDVHAIDNLRAITNLALQRGDTIIYVVASLLEGLSLLKNMKDDAVVRIQNCIAQSQKYQLDPSVHIPQVDILALMLDFACSLHQKSPQMITQKLKVLQARMDSSINDNSWNLSETEVLLPIKKQMNSMQVISEDTAAVIRPGNENDVSDYLTMSFWSKIEAFVMTYTYSGLGLLYGNPRNDKRMFEMWEEALRQLNKNAHKMRTYPTSLQDAIRSADWRRELKCYLQILRGLHLATHSRWQDVWKCVEELESIVKPPLEGIVGLYSCYLSGVYHQGTGDLQMADSIYKSPVLSLDSSLDKYGSVQGGHSKHAEFEVRLLAAFNRIWIMQHSDRRDDRQTTELIDQLRPLCADHPNLEIRTAWNLVLAATQTNPPIGMTAAKSHLATALNGAKVLGDVQTLSIALNLMRAKLFQNIVGDQALKSAKAGASQARRSGNVLWMSVAEGMLAQSYEVQGQMVDAQNSWNAAVNFAGDAFKNGNNI